jgi:hypothetical protein
LYVKVKVSELDFTLRMDGWVMKKLEILGRSFRPGIVVGFV